VISQQSWLILRLMDGPLRLAPRQGKMDNPGDSSMGLDTQRAPAIIATSCSNGGRQRELRGNLHQEAP